MILDRLGNTDALRHLPPRVQAALDYLRRTNLAASPAGRQDIDGDRVFALVQDYETRPADRCAWEAHRKYLDVQHVVHGIERIGYASLASAREREPYDPARDVAFFDPRADFVTLSPGMIAIFGPEDVHCPGVAAGEPARVRKVVVKVAISD